MYFTEPKATGNVMLYVQFITLSLTSHKGLEIPNLLFLSGFLEMKVFVYFFTFSSSFLLSHPSQCLSVHTHQNSLTSTNHADRHYVIYHFPLLLPIFRTNISFISCSNTIFPNLVIGTQTHSTELNSV